MPSRFRAMFIGQGPSGLAEDQIVNTFHFWASVDPLISARISIAAAVIDFYNGVGTGANTQTRANGAYLSAWVARAAEVRVYNLDDAKPRVPYIEAFTLAAAGSASGMPEEVALCLTIKGNPPDTARRRGRLYFGPLITSAMTDSTSSTPTRPTDAIVGDLCKAAARLATLGTVDSTLRWAIRSSLPTENFVVVNRGYVDNAFDTQRRRGPDPTARTLFAELP